MHINNQNIQGYQIISAACTEGKLISFSIQSANVEKSTCYVVP